MKIKVRSEQDTRASQEKNKSNCHSTMKGSLSSHSHSAQRQPRTAPSPVQPTGTAKPQEGASEGEGSSPVPLRPGKEAEARSGPGQAHGFSQRGRSRGHPRRGNETQPTWTVLPSLGQKGGCPRCSLRPGPLF